LAVGDNSSKKLSLEEIKLILDFENKVVVNPRMFKKKELRLA